MSNNANDPAYPQTYETEVQKQNELSSGVNFTTSEIVPITASGLTKREKATFMAMQGLIISGPGMPNDRIAKQSLLLADAILAELERTKDERD